VNVKNSGLAAVSSLEDPVRARLYQVVSQSSEPIGRDEAAAAAGIGRPLAAYHLDKLVELGLLTASYQRPEGRTGPGAGRPAKLYARSGREFSVTVPPREYELAARLLASAVAADTVGLSQAALRGAARQYGFDLGAHKVSRAASTPAASAAVGEVLREHGYEPCQTADGSIELRNCPFHQLAAAHRELVCGMNLALIGGLVAGLGTTELRPELIPRPGRCCVVIGADKGQATPTRDGRS
jgi:predicted ArsR family transcriptional regulator